jgi:hypothetical protein
MKNRQTLLAAIKAICGQANILAVPHVFVDFTGSLDCALLLSQIIYWSERTQDPAGWFYKSHQDWLAEIGLSEYRVRKSVKKLAALGILETAVKRAPTGNPTCHYRLDWPAFSETFLNFLQVRSPKKCANETEKSAETLNTEITTEITDIEKEGGAIAPPTPSFQKTRMKTIDLQPARNPVFLKNLVFATAQKAETSTFRKNQGSETARQATARNPK